MHGVKEVDWEKAHKIFYNEKENLLSSVKRGVERYPYVKEILITLAAGTLLSAAVVMPGLPKVLVPFMWQGRGYRRRRLAQVVKRLKKRKLVEVVETKNGPVVKITKDGLTKALAYKLDEMAIRRPGRWDKKWRIVVFDVLEKKKNARDAFREQLKRLGFYQLQESVFVHAFPCFDEVEFLRQIYGIGEGVTYILAQKIEGQTNLQRIFKV